MVEINRKVLIFMLRFKLKISCLILLLGVVTLFYSCAPDEDAVVVYSGRSAELVDPVFQEIARELPFEIQVRYGSTAELAATIQEEGERTPADLYYAQDAGGLGALQAEGKLKKLPAELLEKVEPVFRSAEDYWIGISGRARVINYNTELVEAEELPDSIWDLTDPRWEGEIGWAPENASFHAFVTALRQLEGEDEARRWLEEMKANQPRRYPRNTPIVEALGRGEISLGLVNNYYLYRFLEEDPDFPVGEHYTAGDAGAMMNVSGIGIVTGSNREKKARQVIEQLLSEKHQRYFSSETHEYPLLKGIETVGRQKPLEEIQIPQIQVEDLAELQETVDLLRDVNVL